MCVVCTAVRRHCAVHLAGAAGRASRCCSAVGHSVGCRWVWKRWRHPPSLEPSPTCFTSVPSGSVDSLCVYGMCMACSKLLLCQDRHTEPACCCAAVAVQEHNTLTLTHTPAYLVAILHSQWECRIVTRHAGVCRCECVVHIRQKPLCSFRLPLQRAPDVV
jgi:hypothetical protein